MGCNYEFVGCLRGSLTGLDCKHCSRQADGLRTLYAFRDLRLDEPSSLLKSLIRARPDKKRGFKHLSRQSLFSLKSWVEEWLALDDEIQVLSGDQTSTQMWSRRVEKKDANSRLGIIRAKSISGKTLGSVSMEWPRFLMNKGPIKQSAEPASDDEALSSWTPDEIRDHNEKLMTRLAPVFTKHVENAVSPILGAAARALQEEQKQRDTLLELEGRQLALKTHLSRRCVGRSRRRQRASSAPKLLRPRTRQLCHRLSLILGFLDFVRHNTFVGGDDGHSKGVGVSEC